MVKGKPGPRPGKRRGKQVDLEEAIADTSDVTEQQADEAEQQEAATQGKNSTLSEDERRALTFHHMRFFLETLQAKKEAAAAHKAARDKAKAELGPTAVADIEDLIALDDPAAEAAMKADLERRLRNARWAGSKIGTQFSLLDGDSDPRPGVERAYEEGKNAGMQGKDRSPPYDPSVPQYTHWLNGWNDGQGVLISALAKTAPDEPPPGEDAHSDTSDRPFSLGDDDNLRMVDNEMPTAPEMAEA